MITIQTNHGDIKVELNAEKAPETVKNFLAYVESGHFEGTIFHRVIENFMIQGGGFDKETNQLSVNLITDFQTKWAPLQWQEQWTLTQQLPNFLLM